MTDDFSRLEQDDILEGYKDEGPIELSEEEQRARLDAFQQKVKKRVYMLMKPREFDAKTRIEAAYWLGESGEPEAIKPLVTVYEKDKTPGMKDAAAYALGQLKALGHELEHEETRKGALERIGKIALYGKMGSRAKGGGLRVAQIVLSITFVLLLGMGFLLPMLSQSTAEEALPTELVILPTDTPDSPQLAAERLQAFYNQLFQDARALQTQFSAITRSESWSCEIQYQATEPLELTPAIVEDEQLLAIAERLNTVYQEIEAVRQPYEAACDRGEALPREDAITYGGVIVEVQRELGDISAQFTEEGISLPPTAVPTETEIPSPAPVPTLDRAQVGPHISQLQFIIDQMTGIRGYTSLLVRYWQDVQNTGSSDACALTQPTIPPDYNLPQDVADAAPTLRQAVQNVNTGLQLTRQSYGVFYNACANNTLAEQAAAQLEAAQFANSSFETAQNLLNTLR